MRPKALVSVVILIAFAAILAAPPPAQAFSLEKWGAKLVGTVVDTVLTPLECPKAVWQEVTRWRERFVVGVPVTAALGCAISTGIRATTTAGDWVTTAVPVTDKYLVQKPRTWETTDPLVSIPK